MKIPTTKSLKIYLSKLKNPKPKRSSSSHSPFASFNFLKTKSFTVDPNQFNVNGQGEFPVEIMVESPNSLNVPKYLHGTQRFFVQLSETNSLTKELPERASSTCYSITPEDLHGTHRIFVQLGETKSLTEENQEKASTTPVRSACEFEDPGLTKTNSLVDGRASNTSDDRSTSPNRALEMPSTEDYEAMISAWVIQEPRPRTRVRLPREWVALETYSMEPHADFRRSMLEMVESRPERNLAVDWNYMEKLMTCYLELNDQSCHEFIWSAFDEVVLEVVAYQQLHRLARQHSI